MLTLSIFGTIIRWVFCSFEQVIYLLDWRQNRIISVRVFFSFWFFSPKCMMFSRKKLHQRKVGNTCPPHYRNSSLQVFYKTVVVKNFAKVHMKAPVPEFLFKWSCRYANWNLVNNRNSSTLCFPVNFAKFLVKAFL